MLKIVQQSVELPASPAALYSMYLDPVQHAAFTGGGPAAIAAAPGTAWSAFDGRIHGRILALTPNRQIVQSWRSFEWHDDDPDSVLVLALSPAGAGSHLDLAQVDVPARLYETLLSGWPSRYWQPWRAYLEQAATRA
jgi:activator of HSP90 ATPase